MNTFIIIIIVIIIIIIAFNLMPSNKESFKALHGLSPLTTYNYGPSYLDNDLSYYDPTYNILSDKIRKLKCQNRLKFYDSTPTYQF